MRKELIVFEDPKSPISEVFRTLRTNIQFAKSNRRMKSVLVTSTYMSEGKSWTSANLAISFVQAGYKVLLVDADMRKGRQHDLFKVQQAPGLSNYLASQDELGRRTEYEIKECSRKTEIPNLYIMPLGNIPNNPSELLLTSKMKDCIEKLESDCDILIIDAPPSTMVTDSVILSRLVDGVVIVVEQNKSKIDDLKRICKDIKNVGGNILGVVLNKVSINKKKYENRYYYYGSSNLDMSVSKYEDQRDDIDTIISKQQNAEKRERGNRFK